MASEIDQIGYDNLFRSDPREQRWSFPTAELSTAEALVGFRRELIAGGLEPDLVRDLVLIAARGYFDHVGGIRLTKADAS